MKSRKIEEAVESAKRLEVLISGRVQGVHLRSRAKDMALRGSIVGFVKNLPDGRVRVIAEGDEGSLQVFLDWCYRGSRLARVDSLAFSWTEATGEFGSFTVDVSGKSFIEDQKAAFKNLGKRVLGRLGVVPKHVVLIADGNRRWAAERGLKVWEGHRESVNNFFDLAKEAKDLGIKYMTAWGFSTENWKRSGREVGEIMSLVSQLLEDNRSKLIDNEIAFHHIGRKDRLPKRLMKSITALESDTAHFTENHVTIALDYGGKDELKRAAESLRGLDRPIEEADITNALDTRGMPDVDLVIRTSGEQRTSGVMPWQSTYAEFYSCPVHLPDFSPSELRLAVQDFGTRKRRFGGG